MNWMCLGLGRLHRCAPTKDHRRASGLTGILLIRFLSATGETFALKIKCSLPHFWPCGVAFRHSRLTQCSCGHVFSIKVPSAITISTKHDGR